MIQFLHNGFTYRTNSDASIVEGHDGKKWNRTHSLGVRDAAIQALELRQIGERLGTRSGTYKPPWLVTDAPKKKSSRHHSTRKTNHQLDHEINEALARRRKRWHGTEVQSLLFARPTWTTSKAKAWAKKHGYRYGDVDMKERYIHLRQFDPVPGTEKRTQTFGKGIKAIIEQVK